MEQQKRYGHFDDQHREYVITDPQTPWPWINYLGNEDFFSLISNTAGGYSFYKDAKFRRITRYRYNNVPMDNGGRYFYINDGDTVWNPGWKPCIPLWGFRQEKKAFTIELFILTRGWRFCDQPLLPGLFRIIEKM